MKSKKITRLEVLRNDYTIHKNSLGANHEITQRAYARLQDAKRQLAIEKLALGTLINFMNHGKSWYSDQPPIPSSDYEEASKVPNGISTLQKDAVFLAASLAGEIVENLERRLRKVIVGGQS